MPRQAADVPDIPLGPPQARLDELITTSVCTVKFPPPVCTVLVGQLSSGGNGGVMFLGSLSRIFFATRRFGPFDDVFVADRVG